MIKKDTDDDDLEFIERMAPNILWNHKTERYICDKCSSEHAMELPPTYQVMKSAMSFLKKHKMCKARRAES